MTTNDPLTAAEQIRAELTTYNNRVQRNHARELVIACLSSSSLTAGIIMFVLLAVYR